MRLTLLLTPLLTPLLACKPISVAAPGDDSVVSADDSAPDSAHGGDSVEHVGGSDSAGEDSPEPEGWPRACDEIYDADTLPTFELTFSDESWSGIQRACNSGSQAYFPITFTYDGESAAAMARLKGNWSWSCDKLQFTISFNEEDPDGRFRGLRKIVLDAPWYDHTLLHERLAFALFRDRGLPYSCANNARVEINGEYYGLYANVERLDHEYLERNFEEPDGNLYQAGSELKTNLDVADTSRLEALQAARTVDEIDALMDLDQAVAEWSMEAMIPAMDNYWAGVEINYYLYDHPTQGFIYLPYDMDIAFGDAAYSDGSLIWPDAVESDPILYEHSGWRKERLFQTVLADPTWCARFVEELVISRAAYDPDALAAQVAAWDAQIDQSLRDDPNKTFTNSRHRQAIASLSAFFQQRADVVDAWLAEGGHCPARW